MTDERAKRFPLALADLVREPRKATARPDARSKPVLKAISGGSGVLKSAAATHKTSAAAPKLAGGRAAKPSSGTHSGTKVSAVAKPESKALPGNTARGVAGSPAASTGEGHRSAARLHATSKPSTVVAHHQPGALRSGARLNETRDAQPRPKTHLKPDAKSNLQPANLQPAKLKPAPQPEVKSNAVRKATSQAGQQSTHALTSERVRERMVERLRANGITDARVLAAMAAVPRHMFVDPGLATQAYEDAALPIGHHQTISKPSVVARMIELVAAGRTLRNVLEIGTGCGYQAAVLSQVAADVYSIERIRPLSERAKLNLRPLRVPNIRLHYGDGRLGLPAVAPFDAIVIACAGLDVPQALLDQLAVGGRLVAPVGSQTAQAQILTLVERVSPTQWRESQLDRVFFVPLKSGVI
ncbi:Protein-L-isoaspartate O-methyltransferase [Caballeronia sp. SBC1]|uniref:protein-L-isoaspartate(D-aspartate) O-methyltransferase n=1 Tax=unclassified Caballeronia TaxID=2646786 RepID=UPI0013E1DF5C|nr:MULTISPECIES: protein-L-isoaspartate(D-aspartate) O-methyltransferase [unclassified Caballeronia]QIE24074.1 Protein-L-isoaspartate O-methyltransferase [Caballeronia sp. SBC2]QIN61970.1 Protein-L-isoaspartate O-methyltransferase [Caballeronia sp. SBC1]